jgi:hypothetical protein
MVENADRKYGRQNRVLNIEHFPKDGGVKRLAVDRGDEGRWFLIVEQYRKDDSKSNSRMVFSLNRSEMSLMALGLLKEMLVADV